MQRYWEVDAYRGIAIIAMIIFHFLFDLNYFKGYGFDLSSGVLWGVGKFAGVSFLLLVGVSLTLSYNRLSPAERSLSKLLKKYGIRGARIFSYGLIITLATIIFVPSGAIIFGILHLIGVSVLLGIFFVKQRSGALFFGVVALLAGWFINQVVLPVPWLVWLGAPFLGFRSFDYYPVLPWFGFVLIGIALGNTLYPEGKRFFAVSPAKNKAINVLSFAGKYSLLIYFIHQLILIPLIILF